MQIRIGILVILNYGYQSKDHGELFPPIFVLMTVVESIQEKRESGWERGWKFLLWNYISWWTHNTSQKHLEFFFSFFLLLFEWLFHRDCLTLSHRTSFQWIPNCAEKYLPWLQYCGLSWLMCFEKKRYYKTVEKDEWYEKRKGENGKTRFRFCYDQTVFSLKENHAIFLRNYTIIVTRDDVCRFWNCVTGWKEDGAFSGLSYEGFAFLENVLPSRESFQTLKRWK